VAELQGNLEVARAVAKAFDAFWRDVISDELLIGLAFTSSSVSQEAQNDILAKALTANPAIWHISWVSPSGVILASSDSELSGTDLGDRPYFQEIVAGHRDWAVSNLLFSRLNGSLIFTACREIRGADGGLLGVMAASILPDRLDAVLGIERTKGAGISIVDHTGMLVYRYPHINPTWEERNWLKAIPQIRKTLDGEEHAWIGPTVNRNEPFIMANVPVGMIGWVAGADRREEDALAAIRGSLMPQTVMFLVVTLAAFGTALVFSRRISASIERLRNQALAFGRGEMPYPVDASGTAELDDLANAFNQMAGNILSREEERRRTDQVLHQNEERLRLALATAKAGAWWVNIGTREMFWSPENYFLYGINPAVIPTFQLWKSCVHPDDVASREQVFRDALDRKTSEYRSEFRIIHPHRGVRWLFGIGRVIESEDGNRAQLTGINIDITDRKIIEEELRKSRDELELRVRARTAELTQSQQELEKLYGFMRRVTDNVPDLIWAKDIEDRFLFVNRAMCSRLLLCDTPDDALGKTDEYFAEREKNAGNEHTFGQICADSDQITKETGISGRFLESGLIRNQYLVLDVHKAPFYSESGDLIGTVGCARDVTKEKAIEESLKKSEERYRFLASKLLRVQEDERKRIGTDLHDGIGQTLVAVKLWVEMALLARDEGNLKEALEKLKSVAPMLGNVIREIRAIFTGLRPTMLDNLGLVSTLQWFCMEFQRLHPEYRIEHKSLVEEEKIPEQLKVAIFRIVQESLNNIAKHSNAEFVEIVLAKSGEDIELVVSDNGVGMDLNQILHSSTARSLGLTSMRERVEMFGGSFAITSGPGEGTTIRACWPVVAELPVSH
jgi:PAS domain S-box-containing protein